MSDTAGNDGLDFYSRLAAQSRFDDLTQGTSYTPLPDDWFVGTADIVGSTQLIEAGKYKLVNTVGAAVISAQINAVQGQQLPFAFGGDGAAFAFWPQHLEAARTALAAVRRWALDEFDIDLRVAIVSVSQIRSAGHNVSVARYQASQGADYAMFDGGGLSWAEEQMKQGHNAIEAAPAGTMPDLTGLSCRWTPMQARNGKILSLVALPAPGAAPQRVASVMHEIVKCAERLERGGHPVPPQGPGYTWPPQGLDLEARATHGDMSVFRRKIQLLGETLLAWFFFRTGMSAGGFNPVHYVETTGRNADFRKFEDGLKMTLDCDAQTRIALETILDNARRQGVIVYGLFEQDEAIMTCIVPSITQDDHIHFIDGAAGGYARAVAQLKTR
ncbi:MAG: DUF3095 domain-containing protein [Rhizobiaceae bacterium]|nr:DUF3095 domain-containing protein [Rhizobiaceae bacterium]